MDESTIKGLESTVSDADIRESRIRRIVVEGYDTSLPREDVDDALREHFGSCGNIIHVYIPADVKTGILNRFALIYVGREAEEDKALTLDGSEMGGRIVVAKAYPFHENHLDDILAPMRAVDNWHQRKMEVTGYDTSLPKYHVENMLIGHFSSCGKVSVSVFEGINGVGLRSKAFVFMRGEDAVDKALELSGHYVGGLNIVITRVSPLPKPGSAGCGGYPYPPHLKHKVAEFRNKNKTSE